MDLTGNQIGAAAGGRNTGLGKNIARVAHTETFPGTFPATIANAAGQGHCLRKTGMRSHFPTFV